MNATPRIALIGGGRMGAAMARGWRTQGRDAALLIIEPSEERRAALRDDGFRAASALEASEAAATDILMLAVKPHQVSAAAEPIAPHLAAGALVISVAAGVTLAQLSNAFPQARVVRAMPNTAAAVGASVTAYIAQEGVAPAQIAHVEALLSALGDVVAAPDEPAMDAITAVSGSGPAYVYLLVEALAEAAQAEGLPAALGARLARATLIGAGRMLERSAETPEQLRINVTSPKGTTAAGLAQLAPRLADGAQAEQEAHDPDLYELLRRAVAAAAARSRELSG